SRSYEGRPCVARGRAVPGQGARDAGFLVAAEAAPTGGGRAWRGSLPAQPSQRRSTRLALVPPKPKLLDSTVRRLAARLSRTSGRSAASGSTVSTLIEPAMKPSCSISRQKIASCTLVAPSEWPVSDLVEENGGTASPNTARIARSSATSPTGVEVPWVLT